MTEWYSQAGQDRWVIAMRAPKVTPGFFVDLGAYDGVQTSNTKALAERGWRGICVEANEEYWNKLVEARSKDSHCLHAAVSGDQGGVVHWSGQTETSDATAPETPRYSLSYILDLCAAPPVIDYMSMDIEGMELEVLAAYDFSRQINLMTVEHNLYCDGPAKKDAIHTLLTARGFFRVVEDAPCLDPAYWNLPYEDWWAAKSFLDAQ